MLSLKTLRPALLALCAAVCGAHGALANPTVPAPTRLDAKVFFAPSEFSEVQLSPSGQYVAVTTSKLTGRRTLYVFDLAGGKPPTQAARMEGLDVVAVRWVNDNRLLFSVRDLSLGSGSRNQEPGGLFAVDRDGENPRTLIRRTAGDDSVGERSLSWDHDLLMVPSFVPGGDNDTVVVGQYRISEKGEIAGIRPFRINVYSAVTRAYDGLKIPLGTSEWLFDTDGEPRVAVTVDQIQGAIHYRAKGSEEWKRIGEGNLLDLPFTPKAVGDDGTLYVTVKRGKDGQAVLTRFDFKTGQPEPEALVSTPGFDFEGSVLLAKGGKVRGIRLLTDAAQTVWFEPALKALQAKVDAALPGRVNTIQCRRCDKADSPDLVALVSSSSDREPGEHYIYRAKGDQWQRVGRAKPEVNPAQMARMDFQRIQTRDGLDMPVWLTYPAGYTPGVKPAAPLPTVVLVHGGPNARGSYWAWNPYTQFLASRGYLVIEPEFRGSEGFGKRYLEAGYKQWGTGMVDDVADALRWAQKEGLASDKACIAGASYGGYATFAGLMRHPTLYRCGVAWVAVTDLMLLAKGASWVDTDISALSRTEVLSKRLGDPVADADMLRAYSPVENADKIKAPVLLSMGTADRRVPLAHGDRMRDALAKAGNPLADYVTYQDEGHSYRKTSTFLDWAGRMERFLAQHLGTP